MATEETTSPPPRQLSRRKILISGAAVAAAGGLATWGGLRLRDPGEGLIARRVSSLPAPDPDDAAWARARPTRIPLEPQQMIRPHLPEGVLADVRARALFDGANLAVRMEWDDQDLDAQESIALFKDAVAIMLPRDLTAEEPPPIFMGWQDNEVYIAQWRASWQKDVDDGYQDVEHLFPGWYSDIHHEHQTLAQLGLDPEVAAAYAPGRDVGNPLSQRDHTSPVEVLTATGYGTLTHADEQRALGRGRHQDGRWHVVIQVPAGNPAPALEPDTTVPMAFAVWRGERGEVGGRKHHSQWVDLVLS